MLPIILVLGTSTSGKTTLCNSSAFSHFYKISTDTLINNMPSRIIRETIKNLFEVSENIELRNVMEVMGVDQDTAAQIITESIQHDDHYCRLRKAYLQDYISHKVLYSKAVDLVIFQDAVTRALDGIPVILDMVPSCLEYSVSELFQDFFAKYSFLETTIVLVHLDIETLAKRIVARNDTEDKRLGMFPFEQYTFIFNAATQPETKVIDPGITPSQIIKAIAPLQRRYMEMYQANEVNNFITNLGFTEDQINLNQNVKIVPLIKYNILVNSAESLSTNASRVYDEAHKRVLVNIIECFKSEYLLWIKFFKGSIAIDVHVANTDYFDIAAEQVEQEVYDPVIGLCDDDDF